MMKFFEALSQMGKSQVLPDFDRERYTPIQGMEGPFRFRSGKVLYYDPNEGKYYDRDTDMYLDKNEIMDHV